jgi:hypothetical protein
VQGSGIKNIPLIEDEQFEQRAMEYLRYKKQLHVFPQDIYTKTGEELSIYIQNPDIRSMILEIEVHIFQ